MSVLVWLTMGIALWHFSIFVPDRFWQGIIGAFIGAVIGSLVVGGIAQVLSGRSIGDTDLITALVAVPGAVLGMAVVWYIGSRREAAV
jgi:hypothetical protein